VIAGTFNIYIIRPDWLGKIGLLRDGSDVRIESHLSQPGFRLTSSGLDTGWIVEPNRIILQADTWSTDCGTTAFRLLENLPWTPLNALGCNFLFRGEVSSVRDWKGISGFPPVSVPTGTTLKQRSWHIAIERDEQVFNLQLSHIESGLEIRANVHTELRNHDIAFAKSAASRFMELRDLSIQYIRDLFQTEIENEFDNT
jgi:hypothetical protein